jgi:hypothetical protein
MCVAAMSLCMIVLIVTRKRGDGRYYFALWQSNNNTPNKLLLSIMQTDKISQQSENCENRNDPDLVQAFLKQSYIDSLQRHTFYI